MSATISKPLPKSLTLKTFVAAAAVALIIANSMMSFARSAHYAGFILGGAIGLIAMITLGAHFSTTRRWATLGKVLFVLGVVLMSATVVAWIEVLPRVAHGVMVDSTRDIPSVILDQETASHQTSR